MKRTKLLASLMMCVFCLSFLVVGVWATVTSVNFNLNGNLQYYPEGVFVELSGQVYRGDSASTLEPLTSDPRFTLETQTNFDNSSSEPSGNFPLSAWDIDNLTFTPVDRFIEIRVTIKNHSAFAITATPTAQLNSQDITTSTFTNFTVSDNRAESETIKSGETKTYSLLIELNESSTAFTGNALSVNFFFEKDVAKNYLVWVADDPDTTDIVDGYWTLTMGEYQGKPLVWRMVLKETEASDGTTDVESVVGYTQDTVLSGSYYFLLDTYIEDVFECSFENNFSRRTDSYNYRTDSYSTLVKVNDYSISNIREYLTGVDVYRSFNVTGSGGVENYSGAFHSSQTAMENFINKFNIIEYSIYNLIEGRTLSDLYSNMYSTTNKRGVAFDSDVKNGVEGIAGIDPENTLDKFWLLSYYEMSKITLQQSITADSGAKSWGNNYWLRSSPGYDVYAADYSAICIDASGSVINDGSSSRTNWVNSTHCARPAFKISF